jgi:hypothetical protein
MIRSMSPSTLFTVVVCHIHSSDMFDLRRRNLSIDAYKSVCRHSIVWTKSKVVRQRKLQPISKIFPILRRNHLVGLEAGGARNKRGIGAIHSWHRPEI